MKRSISIICLMLPVFTLFACAPVTPATLQVAPTPAEEFHPLDTRTGTAELDNLLEAVASGDLESLRSLIQFTNANCTKAEGLGGPPKCREGEVEGTTVEVLPSLGPEGSFLRKDEIGNWPGVDAAGLYSIYEVSPAVTYEEYYPAGKHAILFIGEENQPAISLRVDNGRIVRVDYIFDNSPESLNGWLQREASDVILAPVSR